MNKLNKLLNIEETFSAREVAQSLKVSKDTVYKWVKNGSIESKKVNNKIRFTLKNVQDYLRGQK